MRDIDLFYEKRMNADYLGDFLKALRYSLREELKNNIFKKEGYDMVLQGYRGPSHMCNGDSGDSETIHGPINGVQEIKARWRVSKTVNWVPIIGTIIYFSIVIDENSKDLLEWFSFYFDAKTGEYLSHKVEEAVKKLNKKGLDLFQEGRFSEAEEYFKNASEFAKDAKINSDEFMNNANLARNELNAIQLNNQGDNLFNQERYTEAKAKYQEAYYKSGVNYKKYRENINKAEVEIEANQLNNHGDNLFKQGKFKEAQTKYEKASNKSRHHTFDQNIKKAVVEVEAANLNQEGDLHFANESYKEAVKKYDEAYAKTQLNSQKDDFAKNKEKVEKKLQSIIENLWISSYEAENDSKTDRSEEAKAKFQQVLNLSQEYSTIFPNNPHFKQFVSVGSLKVEGNHYFNRGVELQLNGYELLSEAQKLSNQKNYDEADAKLKEAKSKFEKAQRKFEKGQKVDERFIDTVQITKDQIIVIERHLEAIEKHFAHQQGQSDLDIRVAEQKQDQQQTTSQEQKNNLLES